MRVVIKIFVVIFTLYILHFTLNVVPASALEPVKPATYSADLKLKIKALQEEIASKAAKLKNEISRRMQNRAYIGVVKSKSDTSLTIATAEKTRLVSINEYTQYSSNIKSKTKFNAKTLAVEDYVAVLGDVDDNEVLTAKKIIKMVPPQNQDRQIILGQVDTVAEQTLTVQTKGGQRFSFSVKGNKLTNIKSGKTVIVVSEGSQNSLQARFVQPLGEIVTEKIATPTASPSATPKKIKKSS